jgi:hypothetical protein
VNEGADPSVIVAAVVAGSAPAAARRVDTEKTFRKIFGLIVGLRQ